MSYINVMFVVSPIGEVIKSRAANVGKLIVLSNG
jgi:hypothetical protein